MASTSEDDESSRNKTKINKDTECHKKEEKCAKKGEEKRLEGRKEEERNEGTVEDKMKKEDQRKPNHKIQGEKIEKEGKRERERARVSLV
jgi:hypothetical protein